MSPTESSASGTAGRRRKSADADSAEAIEGLVAPAPGSRRRRRSKGGGRAAKPGGRLLPWLLGALGLAVVALGVVVVMEYTGGGEAAENGRATDYTVYPNEGNTELLASTKVDSRALSAPEVFERNNAKIESQDITFTLGARSLTKDCGDAVWGGSVAKALSDAGCSQAASGAYTSDGYEGVATIFNLRSTKAATAVADELTPPDDPKAKAPGFLVAPDKDGKTVAMGTGYSAAEADINGHYLLVTWVQQTGAKDPAKKVDLSSPLIALGNFDDPLYRRAVEMERIQQNTQEQQPGAAQ
ncbi:hypothetical protein CLV63_13432 [Murinocardiopsis flavida]|uniref:Uncharacterized protein n=1 Tax=Murinocardiopsis flavida TaxID=645275 RepID=A0A2P8CNJ4_9ACTN|nr:hypothetical protein [Murinocardiopsis flavida]PSK86545.1 hypothetical protein CLV63_13432 [Murinocardiopsis flavida]